MEIIPSIVPKDYFDVEEKINKVEGLVNFVHLDVVDGSFAKPATWPYNQDDPDAEIVNLSDIKTSLKIGVHLMVKNPEDVLDEWMDTQAKRIIVHIESTTNIDNVLTILEMSKIESGVALKLDTPIDALDDIIKHVDFVHLMSIDKIGGYGAEYEEEILEKIKAIKKRYKGVVIEVDGGISKNNIKSLAEAGATQFVVGSEIFDGGDVATHIAELKSLIK